MMEKSREEMEKECAETNARAEQCQHQCQRLENCVRYLFLPIYAVDFFTNLWYNHSVSERQRGI